MDGWCPVIRMNVHSVKQKESLSTAASPAACRPPVAVIKFWGCWARCPCSVVSTSVSASLPFDFCVFYVLIQCRILLSLGLCLNLWLVGLLALFSLLPLHHTLYHNLPLHHLTEELIRAVCGLGYHRESLFINVNMLIVHVGEGWPAAPSLIKVSTRVFWRRDGCVPLSLLTFSTH